MHSFVCSIVSVIVPPLAAVESDHALGPQVKLGGKTVSLRQHWIKGTKSPEFFLRVDLVVNLPGPSELEIEVW
jgi:hypothetical protein